MTSAITSERTLTFREELEEQRWDDHRYYHQSYINQALHLFSACCFLATYVLIPGAGGEAWYWQLVAGEAVDGVEFAGDIGAVDPFADETDVLPAQSEHLAPRRSRPRARFRLVRLPHSGAVVPA